MPSMAAATTPVVFGNIRRSFGIRLDGDARVNRTDAYKFDTDEISLRAIQAIDSKALDVDALGNSPWPPER